MKKKVWIFLLEGKKTGRKRHDEAVLFPAAETWFNTRLTGMWSILYQSATQWGIEAHTHRRMAKPTASHTLVFIPHLEAFCFMQPDSPDMIQDELSCHNSICKNGKEFCVSCDKVVGRLLSLA